MIGNTRRKLRYNPDLAEKLTKEFEEEERMKLLENKIEPKKAAAKTTSKENSEFSIEERDDRYVISPIEYRNGIYEVSWSKELLDGRDSHNQDGWIKILENSKWSMPSYPLCHATFAALFLEKDGPLKDKIQDIQYLFSVHFWPSQHWITTSTRIEYMPYGKDKIIHDYGFPSEWKLDADIVGTQGYIDGDFIDANCIEALFGTRDVGEVEKVYEWVSGKKPYLYRLNKRPINTKDVRALEFCFHDHDWFGINLLGDIGFYRPTCGVVLRRIK